MILAQFRPKNRKTPVAVSFKKLIELAQNDLETRKVGLKNSNLPVSSMSLASCRNPGK